MEVRTQVPLRDYLTIRLGGNASLLVEVSTKDEIVQCYKKAKSKNQTVYVLGAGSNTLATESGFDGIVMHNKIQGIEILGETEDSITYRFGAGEIWDDCVELTVAQKLVGIEAMSGIPGTAGAAPIQNIGAYGQELSDVFIELTAYDTVTDSFVILDKQACGFSYRHSIFRGEQSGRYIVTDITLALLKNRPPTITYKAVLRFLEEHDINQPTASDIRRAVLEIRSDKLPDPAIKPNSGSFFKNSLISQSKLDELLKTYPNMPHYPYSDDMYKIPTGWLIEQCGFKDMLINGIRVNEKNTLVLINESATSYGDLVAARDQIIARVSQEFGIAIHQEPLVMPGA